MRLVSVLRRFWQKLMICAAALLSLALLWAARAAPLQPLPTVRFDALSGFFSFALLGGAALAALGQPPGWRSTSWRGIASGMLLAGAWSTTLTPAIAGAYLLVALLTRWPGRPMPADGSQALIGSRRRWLWAAPTLLAAVSLLVGYTALSARGALHYDARGAGAALDGFAFWFVLLAAVAPILGALAASQSTSEQDVFRIAWLYPLARLYSLGPWNTGWSLAALLLGGSAALWAATAMFARPGARRELSLLSLLGMALAGLALGSGAGIAAGCYTVLAYLVLAVGVEDKETRRQGDKETTTNYVSLSPLLPVSLSRWLLSGAMPFSAPFVAAWMLVGASVAGGVALLAGAVWLIMLLNGLATALADGSPPPGQQRGLRLAAIASVALAIGAPLVALALLQPVIEQLQGGLTPYGDVNIWPWVGLATIDAAHTPVTTLPSIAVAALMLVLSALVYLVARLRGAWAHAGPSGEPATPALRALLADLRGEVPWLGALLPRRTDEERRVDGE